MSQETKRAVAIEPYPDDVPIAGPDVPKAGQIDDLIKLLATVRHRFGNTAVEYRIQWGASALWARSKNEGLIDELLAACRAAQDLLLRCDGEARPSDLPPATDEDWDEVVEQLKNVIAKATA